MNYLLFTYPNCSKCDEFKSYLKETSLKGQEYNLVQKENKLRVRDFLSLIKRDDKGAIPIPVFVLREGEKVLAVFNHHRELEEWLQSRA